MLRASHAAKDQTTIGHKVVVDGKRQIELR